MKDKESLIRGISGIFIILIMLSFIYSYNIIYDLTNVIIEAPIQIEDFQYRYDSENEYYYCVPVAIPTYQIKNINHVYQGDNNYIFECSATKTEDGQIIEEKTFTTEIKHIDNSSYANYQLMKQKIL